MEPIRPEIMKNSLDLKAPVPSTGRQTARSLAGFWGDVREAVAGTQRDFTEGSVGRAITLLAIPMVLEMVMESVFGIVNVFWVGRLGADAVATVGITESLLTLVFAVAMGLSMAATAMVARRIGEKDLRGAAIAAVQSIALGLAVSLSIGVVGFLLTPRFLQLMGASPSFSSFSSMPCFAELGMLL